MPPESCLLSPLSSLIPPSPSERRPRGMLHALTPIVVLRHVARRPFHHSLEGGGSWPWLAVNPKSLSPPRLPSPPRITQTNRPPPFPYKPRRAKVVSVAHFGVSELIAPLGKQRLRPLKTSFSLTRSLTRSLTYSFTWSLPRSVGRMRNAQTFVPLTQSLLCSRAQALPRGLPRCPVYNYSWASFFFSSSSLFSWSAPSPTRRHSILPAPFPLLSLFEFFVIFLILSRFFLGNGRNGQAQSELHARRLWASLTTCSRSRSHS